VQVLDDGMTRLSTRCGGRRPKSAKARSRGKYGTRQCSECYGDRMLVAISMVDAAPARGDVHARMQVSPGECRGEISTAHSSKLVCAMWKRGYASSGRKAWAILKIGRTLGVGTSVAQRVLAAPSA
jgi:hypothetical protein